MRDASEIRASISYFEETWMQEIHPNQGAPFRSNLRTYTTNSALLRKRGRGDLVYSDGFVPTPYLGVDIEVTPANVEWESTPTVRWESGKKYLRWYRFTGKWYPGVESVFYLGQTGVWSPSIPAAIRSESEMKMLSNINEQKVNFANNIGEIRTNIGTMADTLRKLGRAYLAYERGQYSRILEILGLKPSQIVDTARDQWLAYRFGWKPLVTDLWGAREAILSSLQEQDALFSSEATVVKDTDGAYSLGNYSQQEQISMGCTTKAWYKITDAQLGRLQALGFANPLATGWELASYSFVVDYFITVSNFLQAVTSPLGVEYITGYQTRFVRGESEVIPTSRDLKDKVLNSAKANVFSFERVVGSTFPVPVPVIRLEQTPTQVLTMVTLITQRYA